jgi:hypothetical protein
MRLRRLESVGISQYVTSGSAYPNFITYALDWHDLDLEARALLKGCLAQNPVETEHLDDYHPFRDPVRLITEIYDLKTVDFAGWTKEDSLCPDCLTRLISAHLHLWLFARKVQGNYYRYSIFVFSIHLIARIQMSGSLPRTAGMSGWF